MYIVGELGTSGSPLYYRFGSWTLIALTHAISFPASTAAIFASVVESATMVCNLLYHSIAPPAIMVTYPAVKRPVSTQSPWETSE